MTKYKLLKDLPNLKKGTIFSENNPFFGARILVTKTKDASINFITNEVFEKFFEEIQEEPTDSIHWKPLPGDIYWFVDYWGVVNDTRWDNTIADDYNFNSGNVYHTEEECRKARNRRLAEVRLRRTSNFKPDFENDNGGWVVYYNPQEERLEVQEVYRFDYGEIVRYETKGDALKSIRENREDWMIYFGIKEEN